MSTLNSTVGTTGPAGSAARRRSLPGVALIAVAVICEAAPWIGFVTGIAATSLAALSTIAVLYTGVLGSIVGIAIRDALSRPPLL